MAFYEAIKLEYDISEFTKKAFIIEREGIIYNFKSAIFIDNTFILDANLLNSHLIESNGIIKKFYTAVKQGFPNFITRG